MGASSSATSTTTATTTTSHGRKYDVFLSFRAEDTSDTFTSHLCLALSEKHIQIKRGDGTSPPHLTAIQESSISLFIFSENYASSKGCLCELVEIIRFRKLANQIVIHVFYQVNPSHVRNQTGSFKVPFVNNNKECRHALTEASSLSGFDSSVVRYILLYVHDYY